MTAPIVRSVMSGVDGARSSGAPLRDDELDSEDATVDFANASLYLAGFQTVFAICCCALVSVLSCWVVPEAGVSAVRTLALCVATGALLMRKPLRVGRAHGVRVIFQSLQPAVPIYLLALVVEQLVHTCTTETSHVPSWRRVVFHGMMLIMLVSGGMRARAPLRETDLPFLLTSAALLVVAILPPPAVAFVGPLCQAVSMWQAADRLVRSFAFATLYAAHVYASTSSSTLTSSETVIVVTRSAAASIWTMGAHVAWLPAAIVQCAVVVVARIGVEGGGGYRSVPDVAPPDDDVELGTAMGGEDGGRGKNMGGGRYSPSSDASVDVLAQQRELLGQPTAVQLACPVAAPSGCGRGANGPAPSSSAPSHTSEEEPVTGSLAFGPMAFRIVSGHDAPPEADVQPQPSQAMLAARPTAMTPARMAEIAASLVDTEPALPK